MAKVVYEHVTKRFGDVIAVNDLSLEIEDREFLVLVGPSGCGKSTVIRLLAGLETLTSGEIYLGDRLVNDVPVRDRDIAMVFQSYALYPHMTVFDNMAFGLRMHGATKESIRPARVRCGRGAGHRRTAQAPARTALRRPATARCSRARHRARASGLPLRRAPLKPRRQAARPDPHRDQQAAPAPGHNLHLRHPRPGGGHDHGHAHRCAQGWAAPPGRHAGRALLPAGQPLRRWVHWQPRHELCPGRAQRHGGADDTGRPVSADRLPAGAVQTAGRARRAGGAAGYPA